MCLDIVYIHINTHTHTHTAHGCSQQLGHVTTRTAASPARGQRSEHGELGEVAQITALFHAGLATSKEHLCTRMKESYAQYLGQFKVEKDTAGHL